MGEKAVRHHTVPQFYLNGFARDRQITTVELGTQKTFVQAISAAAAENHFYSIPGHPAGEDVFEKLLARAESETADVFRQILRDGIWPLTPEPRATLASFMTLQFLRGPDHRSQMEEMTARVVEMLVRVGGPSELVRRAAEKGESLSEAEAQSLWELLGIEGAISAEVPAANHIRQIVELLPELVVYFLGRPWVLVRFTRRALITSDAPLSAIPEPDSDPAESVGLMTAWGMTLPLDRRTAIIIATPMPLAEQGATLAEVSQGRFDHIQEPTTRIERFINLSTLSGASRFVFHHPDDGGYVPDLSDSGFGEGGGAHITRDMVNDAMHEATKGDQ